MQSTNIRLSAGKFAAVLVVMAGLAGCSAQFSNHGYVPLAEDLDQVIVGVDTRASVEETLGAAGSGSVINDQGIYYVRSRLRTMGFRAPEVVEREVVAISFDAGGTVQNVERFGLQDGAVVALSRRVTSSGVANKSFLRQLLGNLGRFNPGAFGS